MQTLFPLRGHFWGRMSDDYFMAEVAGREIALRSLHSGKRDGLLTVGADGELTTIALGSDTLLHITSFELCHVDASLFTA